MSEPPDSRGGLVTRERNGVLLRGLFQVLIENDAGLPAKEALQILASRVELTPHEAGNYPSGGRRFEKLVRFATVAPVKAGWLAKEKGQWAITEAGREALAAYPAPAELYRAAVDLYNAWNTSRRSELGPVEVEQVLEEQDVPRGISRAFELAEEDSWNEVEEFLRAMGPYDFQNLVADLLRAMGYYVDWVAPPGKDGGFDILAYCDPLGTKVPRIRVQVKRQQSRVSVEAVRSFLGVLPVHDVGIFVSTSGFTRDASNEARSQHKHNVTLIPLERLFDLWVAHYDQLSDSGRGRMRLSPVHFLAPQE